MISRIHLYTVLLVASLIWGILLIINGITVSVTWLRYLSTVVGILLFLFTIFDIWLWRLPFLQGWFVNRPDIHGTWIAIIRSNWVDPNTGQCIAPIKGYLAIHQTFSKLNLRLMTKESISELIGTEIVSGNNKSYQIAGIYRNTPSFFARQQSPIHNGAILLNIAGVPITVISGHYWTDRETAGEIELTDRKKKIYNSFNEAEKYL